MIGPRPFAQIQSQLTDWGDDAIAPGISLTAAATGFFFSFRAILVMIAARWLRLGTQPGVAASH